MEQHMEKAKQHSKPIQEGVLGECWAAVEESRVAKNRWFFIGEQHDMSGGILQADSAVGTSWHPGLSDVRMT